MSTRTTLHRLALASAVAAMLASAPSAFAQAADTPTLPAMTTPTTSSTNSTASAPMAGMSMSNVPTPPVNLPTNYEILNNRVFDATNLEQARARGLSDGQIATIVKISKETALPFGQVSAMVARGDTFPAIATEYNLKPSDVYSVDKEKQEISDYDALNTYAKSLGKSDGSMASMPMSGGMVPMSPPMTPADSGMSTSTGASQLDIVQTAMAAKNLTVLVKALQIAGLVDTLKSAGPFTVFAPDDNAFAKLPAGALDALEADPAKLKAVLTYHVIPGNIMAADAMAMTSPTSPPTVEGATLQVTRGKKGRLKINDATVTKADIKASNGTIHIINMVLMPPAADTVGTTPAPMDATPPAAPATPATPGQ